MKFLKWITWDIHPPRMRIYTVTVAAIAIIPWIIMSVYGWIRMFGG